MRLDPFRWSRTRATATKLYVEHGMSGVMQWLEQSGIRIEDLRRAFRKDPTALQIIDDYVNPKKDQLPEVSDEDDSEFVRAVKAHLAGVRSSPFYKTHLSNFLDLQNFTNLLGWFTRYRSIGEAHLLDDGCGVGGFLLVSREKGAASAVGVELEFALARLATIRIKKTEASYCLVANGESLPFASSSFDVVFSCHVIEHVLDQNRYVSEIRRVLKPGGTLFLACPNRLWPKEAHSQLRYLTCFPNRLVKRVFRVLHSLNVGSGKRREQFWVVTLVTHFVSPFTIERLVKRHGLRMVTLNPAERFAQIWPCIARPFRVHRRLLRIASLLLSPEIFAVIEKPSNRSA